VTVEGCAGVVGRGLDNHETCGERSNAHTGPRGPTRLADWVRPIKGGAWGWGFGPGLRLRRPPPVRPRRRRPRGPCRRSASGRPPDMAAGAFPYVWTNLDCRKRFLSCIGRVGRRVLRRRTRRSVICRPWDPPTISSSGMTEQRRCARSPV